MAQRFKTDFIQFDDKKVKKEDRNLTAYLILNSLLYVAIVFFAVFFCWYFYFVSTHSFFSVDGRSMMPTLNASGDNTDGVYVECTTDVDLYDIVVISTSDGNIIKRVIAMEGDYVSIFKTDGSFNLHWISSETTNFEDLTSSDTLVDESGDNGYTIITSGNWGKHNNSTIYNQIEYEPDFYSTFLSDFSTGSDGFVVVDGAIYVQVPQNCILYLGDNRTESYDSRRTGFMSVDNVVGKVDVVVYDYDFWSRIGAVVNFYFKEIENFFER